MWPRWSQEYGWLTELLDVAAQEARERGTEVVRTIHLALAASRVGGPALADAGLNVRRWRDEMNVVIGINRQLTRDAMRSSAREYSTANDRWFAGDLTSDVGPVLARVQELSADLRDGRRGVQILLVALMENDWTTEATTARFLGVSVRQVHAAAGLVVPPRRLVPEGVKLGRAPELSAPILLIGGGHHLPIDALLQVISSHAPRRLTCLFPGQAPAARSALQAFWDPALKEAGAEQVSDAGWYERTDAQRRPVLNAIRGAEMIVVDAGTVESGFATSVGTPALEVLRARLSEGVPVIAYSRGAQLLGVGCLSAWESWGETGKPLRLLSWLQDVVLPHGSSPAAIAHLRQVLTAFPGHRGLGVSHEGALLVTPDGGLNELDPGFDGGSVVLRRADADVERSPWTA